MSTKINVRSPFYINLTEPVKPTPPFDCTTANVLNLSIDQQGQLSTPESTLGEILSITSTDSDFSNGKFATESTNTSRDVTVRISIPVGYSNSDDGYIDCPYTIIQPALVTSGPAPSCSGGPTTNGSISNQTITVNGGSTTIDLSTKFTQGSQAIAGYRISNGNPSLVNASVSGNTLSLSSNAIGGSTSINVSAFDNATNSCTATQSFTVTVSNPSVAFSCSLAGFSGGGITQTGTITKPNSVATVGTIKSSSGGSAITSYPANTTGSNRTVTLYFDLTAPAGFSNAGSTVECSTDFEQPAALPEFTCTTANLSGQRISKAGIVDTGSIGAGTIDKFSPLSFSEVSVATSRTVTFTINVPSGYSNSGTINCDVVIEQPASISPCGSNTYKIAKAMPTPPDYCTGYFTVSKTITSTAPSVENGLHHTVCQNGTPMLGGNFHYAVNTNNTTVGLGTGRFYMWQIDDEGIVQSVSVIDCATTTQTGYGVL